MNKRAKDILVASLAMAAAAGALYLGFVGRSPRVELGSYEALGAVTAEETAKLLGNAGEVLVIARDTGADKNPSVEAQVAAFQKTLKQHARIRPVITRFQATPLLMMATGGGAPPDHLAGALAHHPGADALVLFCGLPPLADAEWEGLRRRGVRTVVVASFRPEYALLLERGLIHLVITPRPESPPPGARPPRSLRERFDQDYAIVRGSEIARER